VLPGKILPPVSNLREQEFVNGRWALDFYRVYYYYLKKLRWYQNDRWVSDTKRFAIT
jgi:hypothetical protein